jgi:hypothetical protein
LLFSLVFLVLITAAGTHIHAGPLFCRFSIRPPVKNGLFDNPVPLATNPVLPSTLITNILSSGHALHLPLSGTRQLVFSPRCELLVESTGIPHNNNKALFEIPLGGITPHRTSRLNQSASDNISGYFTRP